MTPPSTESPTEFHRSDAALVAEARLGDPAARAELVRRGHSRARRLILRLVGRRAEIDDLVQDTFVEAFNGLAQLRDGAAWRSWVGQIAINVARFHLRRRRVRERLGLQDPCSLDHVDESMFAPESDPLATELHTLRRTLDRMPERPRIALILRHVEGYQLEEMATLMRTSLSSVKRWLAAAEEKVREDFEIDDDVPAAATSAKVIALRPR